MPLDPPVVTGNISGMCNQNLILRILLGPTLSGLLLCMPAFTVSAAELSQQQVQLKEHYTQLLSARESLQHSLARGELKQAEIADYRAWIQQLNTRVIQTCQQLSATDKASLPTGLPCDQLMHQRSAPANINTLAETTTAEKTSLIVDQLTTSLGTFDEQLLQEQQRIKAKAPLSQTGGDASGGGASGGTDSGALAENNNGDADADADADDSRPSTSESTANASSDGQDPDSESSTTPGSAGQPGAPQKTSDTAGKTSPEDIPDGSDDDVVARQIREAAEKEKNPVLKEKLWEEYRRYKAGTR